jgi:hypothetical protein
MIHNDAVDTTGSWEQTFGPKDGAWLQHTFTHITEELKYITDIRAARIDDEDQMDDYRRQADEGHGASGDWQLTSPETGINYMMGCNWHGGMALDRIAWPPGHADFPGDAFNRHG